MTTIRTKGQAPLAKSAEDLRLTMTLRDAFAGRPAAGQAMKDPLVAQHLDAVLLAARDAKIETPALIKASILKTECEAFLTKHSAGRPYNQAMITWVAKSLVELKAEFEQAGLPWPAGGIRDTYTNKLGISLQTMWSTRQYNDLLVEYLAAVTPSTVETGVALNTVIAKLRA